MDDDAGALGELDDRAFLELSIWYEGVEGSWEQILMCVITIRDSNSKTWSSCICWSEWLEWKNLQKWLKMSRTRQQRRYRIFCQGCLHYAGKTLRERGNKRVSIWIFLFCVYIHICRYIYYCTSDIQGCETYNETVAGRRVECRIVAYIYFFLI